MSIFFILFLVLVFIVFSSIAFLLVSRHLFLASIDRRLKKIRGERYDEFHPFVSKVEILAKSLLSKLVKYSGPNEKWETSLLRMKFTNAGYRTEVAAVTFLGVKTALTFLLPIMYLLFYLIHSKGTSGLMAIFMMLLFAAVGYYAPDIWLARKIKNRQQQIFESFPNALDLMRVCVSAGLGLDAAIERVGRELEIESKALSEEFHTLNLELRTGATKAAALKNLAERTGVEDIDALVSMLIQTEQFGTSIGDALKVHAEGLRAKRKMRAQEAAAKVPVKLTLPMIICIFPALFIVILGPAIIQIGHTLSPVLNAVSK